MKVWSFIVVLTVLAAARPSDLFAQSPTPRDSARRDSSIADNRANDTGWSRLLAHRVDA